MKLLKVSISGLALIFAVTVQPIQADEFAIEFEWYDGMKECFSKKSPEIKLINLPEGVTKFKVKMVDKDAPGFGHGGGKIKYEGGDVIPHGALKSWKGPCPPSTHTYSFQVQAYAEKKKVGYASYDQKFPQ